MGVSKRLNRLAILGLLACGGAWAQDTVSVTVGLSIPGPYFLVDGQNFTSTQIFQWPVGSVHQIYFVQTLESDGVTLANHQYPVNNPGSRYTFSSWDVVGQTTPGDQPLLIVTVGPTLTQIIGQVTTEIQLSVNFNGFTDPNIPCSPAVIPNDQREGVIAIGSTCYSSPSTFWTTPNMAFTLAAAPFPGYLFTHWLVNGNEVYGQNIGYQIVMPTSVSAVFVRAKRVRIRSNPLGLGILVDRQLIKPGPVVGENFSGDPYCPLTSSLLPVGSASVGYNPLCVGDFDFLPGSQHVIGAPAVQSDSAQRTFVFSGFSNGMGQNATYTADDNISVADSINANFASAVPTNVVTSPPGLPVNVDGHDDSKGTLRFWAEGQTHHLIAPATQTDATGRPWNFASWSNGGSADQNYTVPTGLLGLTLTAVYQPAGKLQVVSVPPGLPFLVDGSPCTTPCVLFDKPTGAQVQVAVPATVMPDALRHYDFRSWDGGSTSITSQVTITDSVQVLVANYQAFYRLTTSSNPANHVTFNVNPFSADGFYADGTQVSVTATPYNGFTFKQWSGDLAGTNLTASVVMNSPRFAVALLDGFPFISENGVRNAAGPTPAGTVGPGSDISIYGDNLADSTKSSPADGPVQTLDGVWVTVNDRLLPLLYISPNVINAQLFSDLTDGDYTLTVHRSGQMDASRNFTVQRDSPGLYQWYSEQGNTVAAFHADGTILNAGSPATPSETITILGTGFGLYDRPLVDGFLTPDTGDWNVADPVKVTVDGQTYTPVSARAANGYAGMVVVKVKLTGTLPSGSVNLKVTVGDVDSSIVQLPVQ